MKLILNSSRSDHKVKTLYNPSVGFFAPRRADESWMLPLDPVETHAEDVYREGNAWNYLWFNTVYMPGLIDLLVVPTRLPQS